MRSSRLGLTFPVRSVVTTGIRRSGIGAQLSHLASTRRKFSTSACGGAQEQPRPRVGLAFHQIRALHSNPQQPEEPANGTDSQLPVSEGGIPLKPQPSATLTIDFLALAMRGSAIAAKKFAGQVGSSSTGWFDDNAKDREALAKLYQSPEYRELHRDALSHSELGLYGGEAGFVHANRSIVDPDNPHLPTVYTDDPKSANLWTTSYSEFRRNLHNVDLDKLMRHGRRLPKPTDIFNDFVEVHAPVSDRGGAALIKRYQYLLSCARDGARLTLFHECQEMFERMLNTSLPAVEVGPHTHAAFIRCCAQERRWKEGLIVCERAEDISSRSSRFVLGSDFYDSVVELCAQCGNIGVGLQKFEDLLVSGIRPQEPTLCAALRLCADGMRITEGEAVWKLFDYYQLKKSKRAYTERCRWVACLEDAIAQDETVALTQTQSAILLSPETVFAAINEADSDGTTLDLNCFCWVIYALRRHPSHRRYISEILTELNLRGLGTDYQVMTFMFAFCARNGEGQLALQLEQHRAEAKGTLCKLTSELVLLQLQAFAKDDTLDPAFLEVASRSLAELQKSHQVSALEGPTHHAYFALCARLGAAEEALSFLKTLLRSSAPEKCLDQNVLSLLLVALRNSKIASKAATRHVLREVLGLWRIAALTESDSGASATPSATTPKDGSTALALPPIAFEAVLALFDVVDRCGRNPSLDDLLLETGLENWLQVLKAAGYQGANSSSSPSSSLPQQPTNSNGVTEQKETATSSTFTVEGGGISALEAQQRLADLPNLTPLLVYDPSPDTIRQLKTHIGLNHDDLWLRKLRQSSKLPFVVKNASSFAVDPSQQSGNYPFRSLDDNRHNRDFLSLRDRVDVQSENNYDRWKARLAGSDLRNFTYSRV